MYLPTYCASVDRDNFGPYGIIFINLYVVLSVAVVMLFWVVLDNIYECVCVYYLSLSHHSGRAFYY